jgi:uncharacterized protein YjbJ (UPF0337 family)
MNWDEMAGNWMDTRNKVRERWGKLTDQDLVRIGGKREELIVVLAERYGWPREQVERQVKDFERSSEDVASTPSGESAGQWGGGTMEEADDGDARRSSANERTGTGNRQPGQQGGQTGQRSGQNPPPGQKPQYGQGDRERKST